MGTNYSKGNQLRKIPSQHLSTGHSGQSQKSDDTSKIEKFKYIEGRRFHNWPDVHYDLPNDDDEGKYLYKL
jgi:hypothetical protein